MAEQGLTPQFAAAYRDIMVDGLGRERQVTSKVLAAVPDNKADYRPDPNAKTAWELAWHIANSDIQFLDSIADLNFTMGERENKPKNVAELVKWYDENFARGLERVRAMSGEQLATPVNFLGLFNFPAVFYLGFLNNHCIHHRGQLSTYLRPMGSKVPSIYGGSYDEPFQMPEGKESAA